MVNRRVQRGNAATGIGERDTPRAVCSRVSGPGVVLPMDAWPAAQVMRQACDGCAIALEANYPPTGALTAVQPAFQVEVKTIGPVGFRKILGAVSSVRVVSHYAAVWDIGEKQGLAIPGRSFGCSPIGAGYKFKFPVQNVPPFVTKLVSHRRVMRVHCVRKGL